jgi:serine/threonine-protein kinase
VAEGLIISQDLEAGTSVAVHSTVYYVISTGVADITVPDVTGKSQTVAETTLKSSGLETKITQENSDTVDIGNVIRTVPAAGTAVSTGSTVEVVVSLGKEDTQVEVPNVVGLSENTAKKTLTGLNLKVVVDTGTSTKVSAGQVMAQSIASGTKVDQKTEITITINSGTTTVTDPDNDDDDDDTQEEAKVWACNQRLDTPPNYSGGAIRLTLSQVVNGQTVETTVVENENPEFPLTFATEGAEGVSVGTVYVYEKIDGEYKKIAKYTVPFEEY